MLVSPHQISEESTVCRLVGLETNQRFIISKGAAEGMVRGLDMFSQLHQLLTVFLPSARKSVIDLQGRDDGDECRAKIHMHVDFWRVHWNPKQAAVVFGLHCVFYLLVFCMMIWLTFSRVVVANTFICWSNPPNIFCSPINSFKITLLWYLNATVHITH